MPLLITDRLSDGVSEAPFDVANLGDRVGDDPERVAKNRTMLAERLRPSGVRGLVWMQQVHGREVAYVDAEQASTTIIGVDALVTTCAGLGLVVQVADCLPVILENTSGGVVAVVHAGREGCALDVVGQTVERMRQVGDGSISAHIGPHICGRCYEVPQQMQDDVVALLPGSASRTRWASPGLDLAAGVIRRLSELAVVVTNDHRCTYEDTRLYSHRRDGRTGRFAAVAWLP